MLVLLFLHVSLTIHTEMYGVGIRMLVLGSEVSQVNIYQLACL